MLVQTWHGAILGFASGVGGAASSNLDILSKSTLLREEQIVHAPL
jgi:hypothetical protein